MSDYLAALISRTFDEPDVVRPRSISRFERRSMDLEPVPREDVVPPLTAPKAGIPAREAGSPNVSAGMDALRKPLKAEQRRYGTAVTPREVSPSSPRDDTLFALPPTTEPLAPRVTNVRPPPGSPRENDAGVWPEQERIRTAPVAALPIPQPASMERLAQAPHQPTLATPPRAVLPAAGQPHPVPDSPPRPIESAAVIEPRIAAQASPRFAPPSEPPAIHVTIGRIEIRATSTAATPVRRQHRQPPVMSLDEYLEQCAGGGQR